MWLAKVASKHQFKPASLEFEKMTLMTLLRAMWRSHKYHVVSSYRLEMLTFYNVQPIKYQTFVGKK
jgi:hypothetical protein